MSEIITMAKKAADAWRNTDTYHQAAQIIDMLVEELERKPTLTPPNDPMTLGFDVVDTTTGKYPDWERITIEEPWANRLVDCDMDGIAIREDGSLILLDKYGNCVSCPPYRFEIRRPLEGEA